MNQITRTCIALAVMADSGCSPNAVFFHETTKIAISAEYKQDSTEPINGTFGFKRRIVAITPAQDPADDAQKLGNRGEALSLVSRFDVTSGSLNEGVVIVNNFASGAAARVITAPPSQPVSVPIPGTVQTTTVRPQGGAAPRIKSLMKKLQ